MASKIYQFLEDYINNIYFNEKTYEFDVVGLNDFRRNVFFVELNGPKEILHEIHEKIEEYLFNTFSGSFERDKKFKIHITIARFKRRRRKKQNQNNKNNIKNLNQNINIKNDFSQYNLLKRKYTKILMGKWIVNKVVLKKSMLTQSGPIYENLEF